MTCLKYLSKCPCPRCLILKSRIPRMGSKSDTRDRLKLVRVDSESRRQKVELARKLLFEKGINVTSVRIKNLLDEQSLTPTRVCLNFIFLRNTGLTMVRTRFRRSFSNTASTSTKCSPQTFFMSLNWAFGRLFSLTFCASCMLLATEKFKNSTNGASWCNTIAQHS